MYEMDWLNNIADLQDELRERTYVPREASTFVLRERGTERPIRGEQVRDRVVEHSLNDNVVVPSIRPYLIYDNGASLAGKGVAFTRRELVKDLVSYYNRYGNRGYVLLIDFKKYYDNIRHDVLMQQFWRYVHDDTALWLLETIISGFQVDVSYMDDAEYAHCMDTVFSSLEYWKVDKPLLTGQKYMAKHLDIGNQTSQSAGVLYPTPIDNYVKIVRGVKYYARYMDDSYVFHPDREYLKALMADIIRECAKLGITVNAHKTHVAKLSDRWRFLQIQYSLTDTGRIVQKIHPKRLTERRRLMKKLAPRMTDRDFTVWVDAWIKSNRKYMSKQQYANIKALEQTLRKETKCTR
ncbi:MAG: RNA-directed DNA polymerase [Clostridiales bacterium]|nr:RNA-directed DNA polymerase [Clostridiales bacterium]